MFKDRNFLDDVKVMYTDLINQVVDREEDKLQIFDASGPYLATKKIGKNNPRENEIRSDNQLRQEWNQTVDQVLIAGGSQEEVTTYTYKKEWSDDPVDSESFEDPAYQGKNMVLTNVEDEDQWAENVSFGAYKLNEDLIKRMSSTEEIELALSDELLGQFDKNTKEAYERFYEKKTEASDSVQTDSGYQYIHVKGNLLDAENDKQCCHNDRCISTTEPVRHLFYYDTDSVLRCYYCDHAV